MDKFSDHLCEWVCMICTIWNHDWGTWSHLEQSVLHGELFSLFLSFKNEPCKIIKKHCKIQGFELGRLLNWAKTCSKCCFLLLSKSCKNLVKHRVSGTNPHPKNEPTHMFRFCVDKKGFSIIHGFVSVKLRFRSVNKRFFLYFLVVFWGLFLGPDLACYKENHKKTL